MTNEFWIKPKCNNCTVVVGDMKHGQPHYDVRLKHSVFSVVPRTDIGTEPMSADDIDGEHYQTGTRAKSVQMCGQVSRANETPYRPGRQMHRETVYSVPVAEREARHASDYPSKMFFRSEGQSQIACKMVNRYSAQRDKAALAKYDAVMAAIEDCEVEAPARKIKDNREHYRSVLVAGCAHSRDVPVRKIVPLTPFKHYVLKTHVATINYRAAEPTHVNRGRDDSEPKAKAGRPLVPRRRKSYMTVSSPMQCQSFEELQSIASVFYVYRDGEEVNEVPRTVRIIWMVWYSLKELLGTYYPGGKVVARKYQLPDKEDWTHR